ncbi:DUF6438 domain-containing protein [Tundrisphaera sp. TA3]|uniref:DUF6438 domain-containing protein n=1 Tax=Tundrisphaera sp. TA3 TaxID=3435775 RepID=UPI003EB6F25B
MGFLLLCLMSMAPAVADEAITEIALRRSPCFGKCPVDEVILRSDGTAEYVGTRFVPRLGKYRGKLAPADFETLAKLLADRKFFALDARYARPITDQATWTTSAKRGAVEKKVEDYGGAGPEGLKEIERRIVEVMDRIEWQKAG